MRTTLKKRLQYEQDQQDHFRDSSVEPAYFDLCYQFNEQRENEQKNEWSKDKIYDVRSLWQDRVSIMTVHDLYWSDVKKNLE